MADSKSPSDASDTKEGETGDAPPTQPWYRRPINSLAIGLFVAILLGMAIFLLADKTGGNSGTTQTPTSPTAPAHLPGPGPGAP